MYSLLFYNHPFMSLPIILLLLYSQLLFLYNFLFCGYHLSGNMNTGVIGHDKSKGTYQGSSGPMSRNCWLPMITDHDYNNLMYLIKFRVLVSENTCIHSHGHRILSGIITVLDHYNNNIYSYLGSGPTSIVGCSSFITIIKI